MKLWLICSFEGAMPAGGYTSLRYREARQAALSAAAVKAGEKPFHGQKLRVYISHSAAAKETAEALCPGARLTVHDGLDEAAPTPGAFSDAALPLALREKLDAPKREAKRAAAARGETLIAALETAGEDAALFSHTGQIPLLMDALRVRGYCFHRSELGAIHPGERILVTSRAAHCGGCGHNCMLTNPGCGVGRDKAQRAGISFKTGENDGTDKG